MCQAFEGQATCFGTQDSADGAAARIPTGGLQSKGSIYHLALEHGTEARARVRRLFRCAHFVPGSPRHTTPLLRPPETTFVESSTVNTVN